MVSGEYHSILFVVHILIELDLLSSDGLSLFSAFSRVLVMCVYDMLAIFYHSNFGKLNYYLGAGADRDGRPSRYPQIDFCKYISPYCSYEDVNSLDRL